MPPKRLLYLVKDDGSEAPVIRDEYGGLGIINWEHHLIHEGHIHCTGDKFAAFGSSDSDKLYIIKTGTQESHLLVTLQGNIAAYTVMSRNPTITAYGSEVQFENANDSYSSSVETKLYFQHGTTAVSDDGDAMVGATEFNAGSKTTGETRTRSEKELRANTEYLLRFSAEQATAGIGVLKICVYEPETTPVRI